MRRGESKDTFCIYTVALACQFCDYCWLLCRLLGVHYRVSLFNRLLLHMLFIADASVLLPFIAARIVPLVESCWCYRIFLMIALVRANRYSHAIGGGYANYLRSLVDKGFPNPFTMSSADTTNNVKTADAVRSQIVRLRLEEMRRQHEVLQAALQRELDLAERAEREQAERILSEQARKTPRRGRVKMEVVITTRKKGMWQRHDVC